MSETLIRELGDTSAPAMQFVKDHRPGAAGNAAAVGITPDSDAEGRYFRMSKPWAGNLQPPSDWDPRSLNFKAPEYKLQLDYVYGFRTRQARDNLHWIDEPNVILYHAAAVCVVADVNTRTQRYYQGHSDDILSLAYNREKRIAASGGIGKRNTAPLNVWSVDTLKTIISIQGFLEFAVVSVALSADGSRVFGIGDDNSHTVALYDVSTGILLASCKGDSNKVFHAIADTTMGKDSKRDWVTIGSSHVKFWTKEKGKDVLAGKKAIGGNIAKQTMMSVACTASYVCVGNVSGQIYFFSEGVLVKTLEAHTSHCGGLTVDRGNILYSGGRDGLIKQWTLTDLDIKKKMTATLGKTYDLNPFSSISHPNRLVKKESERLLNGPRALSICNGKILCGTRLGSMYILPNEFDVTTVLECHFDSNPDEFMELWGCDMHPKEPLFCTASDDCTLRLWSLDLGTMILMTPITFPARACAFSPDGNMIAVGHTNGAFSVWDAMTLTPILPFTRKRSHRIQDIAFSPDGRFLAMSMGQANVIDVYYVKRNFEYVGFGDAFSSNIKRMDWSSRSDVLMCCTAAYEILHFNIPSMDPSADPALSDEKWATTRCILSWGAQGIWEDCNDGTDINAVGRSRDQKLLVVGYDSSRVRLFNYPCLPKIVESTGVAVFPEHHEHIGHSSHITAAYFSPDDKYVITCGGMDLSILRWKVVPVDPQELARRNEQGKQKPTVTEAPDDIAVQIAHGTIRELGESRGRSRRMDPEVLYPTDGHGPEGQHQTSANMEGFPSGDERQRSALENTSTNRRPQSKGRPGSPSYNRSVQSRLLNSTTSMETKLAHGRAQRAHILQQEQARRRFK